MSINPRKLAVGILSEVLAEGAYNNIALREAFAKHKDLDNQSKAFVTDVVNGTLRNLIHIDHVIAQFAKGRTKPYVKQVLRLSVYQLFYTENPSYAVVNEATDLIKGSRFKASAGFVNGILRSIERNKDQVVYPKEKLAYLSVKYSFPLPLLTYFRTFLSEAEIEAFVTHSVTPPKVTICVNTLKTTCKALITALDKEGVIATPSSTHPEALILTKVSDVANLSAYQAGLFHVMDPVSMSAVQTLDPAPGGVVYDLCAAPGGKTFYMGQRMKNQGKIVATDIHEHKVKLLRAGAQRLGLSLIEAQTADALKGDLPKKMADYVLLDAPCSGFGIIRKKPDIKYTKTLADVEALAKIQRELLEVASDYTKPGGKLVYATCTLSVKENQENVAWFVANYPYQLITEKQYTSSDQDGFYTALLQRKYT